MCGRYVLALDTGELVPLFGLDVLDERLPGSSYNIAPSQTVPIVVQRRVDGDDVRALTPARWGLVPPWAKSLTAGPTPINARCETVMTSGMFRRAYAKRRAIVPATGFYERRNTGDKQSYYVHPRAGGVLAFAGLHEAWRLPEDAGWLVSTTIITRPAEGQMISVHDREPLYLAPDLWDSWLDPDEPGTPDLLDAALSATAVITDGLDFRPVGGGWLSTRPGFYRTDATLIEPAFFEDMGDVSLSSPS